MAIFTAMALIGAAVSGSFAAAGAGITLFGTLYTGLSAGLIVGGASLALSAASTLMAPKPKALAASTALSTDLTQQIRQAITTRKVIYGAARVSGPLTYIATTPVGTSAQMPQNLVGGQWTVANQTVDKNSLLHVAIPLATHACTRIDDIYLNDDALHVEMLDNNGFANSGTYSGKVRIHKHLGADSQTADTQLLAENPDLDSNFRGQGITYVYARYQFNTDIFQGIPNLSAYVYGKPLYDPRDGGTRWSSNPALAWRDYMTSAYGMGATADEIDDAYVIAAANACDEMVTTKDLASTATLIDTTNNWIETGDDVLPFEVGDRIHVTSTGTAPAGLVSGTDYYAVPAHYIANPAVRFAATYADALAGTTIDLTSAGSGTITITKNGEPRFTLNGVVDLGAAPVDILGDMLSAMGGRAVFSGGKWRLFAAVWMAPTVFFDDDDFIGEVVTQTVHSRRDLFNALQGTYIASANLNQPTNYPAVTNATWQAQDGGTRIFNTLDFPFTNRAQTAQRLAKIELERHRRQMSADIPLSLVGLMAMAGENVGITHNDNGWDQKSFEIVTWASTIGGGPSGNQPLITTSISVREVDAACFDFDETTDEVQPHPAPATNLPDAFSVEAPTDLVLVTGTAALFDKNDGTQGSRIVASWIAAADGFVDQYETQYKKSADTDWSPSRFIGNGIVSDSFWEVVDGTSYDVRVRAISVTNSASAWLTGTVVVVGKTEPPSDVASLFAQQNGILTNSQWTQVTDPDLAAYELRYGPELAFVWDDATVLTTAAGAGQVARGTSNSSGTLPPGNWTLGIKAVDTSGNYSLNAATYNITITNVNSEILDDNQEPVWPGTLTYLVKHDLTGRLVMESQNADSTGDNFDVFDNFVLNPQPLAMYDAAEFDAGIELQGARVYAEIGASLGPGVVGSGPKTQLQIDYISTTHPSYTGFANWGFGSLTFEKLKTRVLLDSSLGAMYLSHFKPVVDAETRRESGVATVDNTGTPAITFSRPFVNTPAIQVTPQGSALTPFYDNEDNTGFKMHLKNSGGTEVGGTASWTADGI